MSPGTYRFGPYEIHTRTRELYKYGIKLKVRPQPFQVPQVLVEHAGDVVTREELRQILWPAETFVDFEHGLNTSIKELRQILSDSASKPRYIETLPKLGYRIVAPVEAESDIGVAVLEIDEAPAEPEAPAVTARPKPVSRFLPWIVAAVFACLTLAVGAVWFLRPAKDARTLKFIVLGRVASCLSRSCGRVVVCDGPGSVPIPS